MVKRNENPESDKLSGKKKQTWSQTLKSKETHKATKKEREEKKKPSLVDYWANWVWRVKKEDNLRRKRNWGRMVCCRETQWFKTQLHVFSMHWLREGEKKKRENNKYVCLRERKRRKEEKSNGVVGMIVLDLLGGKEGMVSCLIQQNFHII